MYRSAPRLSLLLATAATSGVALGKTGTGFLLNPSVTVDLREEEYGSDTSGAAVTQTSGNAYVLSVAGGMRRESGLFFGARSVIELSDETTTTIAGGERTSADAKTFWRGFGGTVGYISDDSFAATISYLPYIVRELKSGGDETVWSGGYGLVADVGFRFDVSELQLGPLLAWRSYSFKKVKFDPASGESASESVDFTLQRFLPYLGFWFYF